MNKRSASLPVEGGTVDDATPVVRNKNYLTNKIAEIAEKEKKLRRLQTMQISEETANR